MINRPTCALCLHRCTARWVGDQRTAFCPGCVVLLGRFITEAPARTRLWPALESEVQPTSEQRVAERPPPAAGGQQEAEAFPAATKQLFSEFKAGLQVVVRPEDARTHSDLAIAYREMGLIADALHETAIALQHQEKLSRQEVWQALGFCLDRRWLRLTVEDALVILREALFAN